MDHVVRVWVVPVDVSTRTAARCVEVLDDSERTRAAAFFRARDRHRFTVAHGVLRMLAGEALDTPPAALRWIAGRHGKPSLAPPWSGLHTSLSHSGTLVAVAISASRPVGVDIQQVESGQAPVELSARFYAPDEAGYVAADPEPAVQADRFAHLWARKEAVVKAAAGRLWPNLSLGVRDHDVVRCIEPVDCLVRVADVVAPAGYRAAAALTGAAPFVVDAVAVPAENLARHDWPRPGYAVTST